MNYTVASNPENDAEMIFTIINKFAKTITSITKSF